MRVLLCRLLQAALKCRLLWLALVPLAVLKVASFVAQLMAVVRDQRWSLRSGGNDLELLLKQACNASGGLLHSDEWEEVRA